MTNFKWHLTRKNAYILGQCQPVCFTSWQRRIRPTTTGCYWRQRLFARINMPDFEGLVPRNSLMIIGLVNNSRFQLLKNGHVTAHFELRNAMWPPWMSSDNWVFYYCIQSYHWSAGWHGAPPLLLSSGHPPLGRGILATLDNILPIYAQCFA